MSDYIRTEYGDFPMCPRDWREAGITIEETGWNSSGYAITASVEPRLTAELLFDLAALYMRDCVDR